MALKTFAPSIDPSVPAAVRLHLQLIYRSLNNHAQAMGVLNGKSSGNTTQNITEQIVSSSSTTTGGGSSLPGQGTVNNQSGVTAYTTQTSDSGALVVFSDASAIAVTLNTTVSAPWMVFIANQGALGAGTVTLTPQTGTISYAGSAGAASMPLLPGYCCIVVFDGTNFWAWTEPIVPVDFAAVAHEFLTAYNAATGAFTAAQPDFTDISGVAAPSQLPTPTAASLGGVEAAGPVAHEWISEIDTSGVPHLSQPDFSDISGTAASAQLPTPTTGAIGGVKAVIAVAHEWVSFIDTSGTPQLSQPTAADVVPASGATTARPTGVATGFMYFDTTLGIPVWWDGTAWVNASGTSV